METIQIDLVSKRIHVGPYGCLNDDQIEHIELTEGVKSVSKTRAGITVVCDSRLMNIAKAIYKFRK